MDAETWYTYNEWELLAIIYAYKHFHKYFIATPL